MRERIVEVLSWEGYVYKYDFFFFVEWFYDIVIDVCVCFGLYVKYVVGYGYLGDGNLYFNVMVEVFSLLFLGVLEFYVYEWMVR